MNNIATATAQGPETGARDELRLKVLRALEANPEMSQRQLAAELGVSLGGVNYALKALIERGFVKADNFRKSGSKVAYLYMLTPKGITEKTSLATAFLGRKLAEYEVLKQEIEALKGEVGSGGSGSGARS
jgi:EPS-associated MarR family transcriptional regulator